MKTSILLAALACLISVPAFAQESSNSDGPELPAYAVFSEPPSPADAEAIATLMRDFSIAWGRGDAAGAAAAYASDVEWTNAFGEVIRGSGELQRKLARLFTEDEAAVATGEETSYRPLSLRYIGDDAAIVHGVTTSMRGGAADGSAARRVHLTFVLAKRAGTWKIVHQVIMDARA